MLCSEVSALRRVFIWPQLLNLEFIYERGEGERGGEERHTASRIGCFSAPSSHQEEQFGCTFTPKPAKLFSHRANELSFHNMDQSIVDSFDTLVCSQFWPLRLQKYWGSAWIKMPFHVNHGDPRVSLAGAV